MISSFIADFLVVLLSFRVKQSVYLPFCSLYDRVKRYGWLRRNNNSKLNCLYRDLNSEPIPRFRAIFQSRSSFLEKKIVANYKTASPISLQMN